MNKHLIVRSLAMRGLMPAAAIAALLLAGALPALADRPEWGHPGNPGILPPQSHPLGKSYGEWAAAWWQWALSIPADRNPINDPTGAFSGEGQSGPVWFLAGTFGNDVERSCVVPAGKAVFMPVFNWIFGAGVFDCEPTVPGVTCDVPTLRAAAALNTTAADILEVTIDGKAVRNVRDYRAWSPHPFKVTYPENSVIGVDSGTYFPQVADGYWLMLAPPCEGEHELRVHVRTPGTSASYGPMEFVVLYHLTVAEKPDIFPPRSHPYGKSYAEWSAKWWQWAYSLPGTGHPLIDQTGANVAAGQSGNVWFLGGTYSAIAEGDAVVGRATRVCTVPAGKALFFPILNSEANNFTVDADGNQIAPTTLTEAELRATCQFNVDHARNMTCTIDGWPLKGLENVLHTHYRVESPVFQYTVPAGDSLYELWGMHISGQSPPPGAVADGVYLMLAPFEAGHHTIDFTGEIFIPGATPAEDFLFRLEIRYIITVPPCHR
jgi:hypothetical protein